MKEAWDVELEGNWYGEEEMQQEEEKPEKAL
jgi:hypothetical protein